MPISLMMETHEGVELDFADAIASHTHWKTRLAIYLAQEDRSWVPEAVAATDQCDLGKWIVANAEAHAHLPQFQRLDEEHAHFHREAGEVVRRANAGRPVDADVMLGSFSEYARSSSAVIRAIMALRPRLPWAPLKPLDE